MLSASDIMICLMNRLGVDYFWKVTETVAGS